MTLRISTQLQGRIVRDCLARRPIEACGVVSAKGRFIPLANASDDPSLFSFHPEEQLRVWQELDAAGDRVDVVYHSHPRTPAAPSRTDVAFAAYPDVHYVIVGLADPDNPEFRSWHIEDGQADEETVLFWC
ncbi:MAG TPA: M67 family metallopeptidase [Nocardioides sp.]|nr:M67 family metallopeptidase [Nocardioides sp.]